MKQIIIVEPGSLSPEEKAKLPESIILIEHPEPEKVRIVTPLEGFSGDDLVQSLIHALSGDASSTERSKFARALFEKLKK